MLHRVRNQNCRLVRGPVPITVEDAASGYKGILVIERALRTLKGHPANEYLWSGFSCPEGAV
jgi:hypothetical protein